MTQQATKFITTPSREMDEIFKLLAKHNMLQYIIHVLKWHPFPIFPQWTWNHNHKIYARAGWEVPNYNFILPLVLSIITKYIVDSSISKSKNLQWWLESCYKKLTNFPLIIMLFWHCKWQGASNSLPILCCWPQITFASWFIGMEFSPPNKLWNGQIIVYCACFLKILHLILWEINPFLHMPNRWNNWSINYIFKLCTPHAMIHVICTKLKLVKFEGCTCELTLWKKSVFCN
jgi:hypothetical protein